MRDNLEVNKRNAIAFYRTAYLDKPVKAVVMYAGAEYIQHNPRKSGCLSASDKVLESMRETCIKSVRRMLAGSIHLYAGWKGNGIWVH